MSTLYENITELCAERGIKGGKMCTDLGISKGLLTDLKMGRRSGVSAKTADKIASYFGVTVSYLLGTEEKNAPANVSDSDTFSEDDIKAAFFNGADPTMTKEEQDAMWEDAQEYFRFKMAQRRQKQQNEK